jgi:hypothetical protein
MRYMCTVFKGIDMRRILALILLSVGVTAMAQPYQPYHHHHGHWQRGGSNGWMWVAPTIVGGVIGYELARNQPVVINQQPPVIVNGQPVIVQQPVVVQQPQCSPWTEILNSDGTITRTRTCAQ